MSKNAKLQKRIWIVLMLIMCSCLVCACGAASENDKTMSIDKGGEYSLSGEIGQTVIVDAPGEEVTLILDNAYIQPISGPAICIENAEKVTISVEAGTDNTLKDEPYRNGDTKYGGCIYSKCDIEIAGNGQLNVYGYYESGIRCKDRLHINGAKITVVSKHDAIKANDGITIDSSVVSVQAEENGIVTTKIGKNSKGLIAINDSTIDIIAGGYGLVSKSDCEIEKSSIFNKSVLGQYKVEGDISLGEGVVTDE